MEIELYLDLLKRCVSNTIYDDDLDLLRGTFAQDPVTKKLSSAVAAPTDPKRKTDGAIWPSRAHTMIGLHRLDNLRHCVDTVIRERVPGDLIETGVWRGGASIFMRGILKAFDVRDRRVWVADSFEGLPPVDEAVHAADAALALDRFSDLAVSLEVVRANFARYDLLDEQVVFLKGWFRDTLPDAPIERLAVMRLDGDLFESTMDALTNLYPKLSPGGFVILDDYNVVAGCNEATDQYRQTMGITEPLALIQGCGAFWRKANPGTAV
jgi:demethyldecarbamoylnovobiocin O-methyltransferase/8-demethyl-8-(2,3-dimethoxy-alpha-L-rhamnosyl)tetracenomycin-C 4'-O-methyltransferase